MQEISELHATKSAILSELLGEVEFATKIQLETEVSSTTGEDQWPWAGSTILINKVPQFIRLNKRVPEV